MKTSNKMSGEFVGQCKPFKANNLSGTDENNYYVVWSYGWYPLFAYHYQSRKWFENMEKYSISTSKQKTQCRPKEPTVFLSHAAMKDLIQRR